MSPTNETPSTVTSSAGSIFLSEQLHPKLRQALERMKFETPTPIQAQAIPAALEGKDLMGQAATGTGKTLAFLVPALQKLLNDPKATALVLAPTRELVTQIVDVVLKLIQNGVPLNCAGLTGGTSMIPQLRNLKKNPQIIIATPGRLMDHVQRRSVFLGRTSFLVLDEADRMLDMGFAPQIKKILTHVPAQKQTLLFSATFPNEILSFAKSLLVNPVRIEAVKPKLEKPLIDQKMRMVGQSEKNEALLEELAKREGSVLIFARTQIRTERAAKFLDAKGIEVACIHGGRSQGQRNRALKDFRENRIRILVATDVAARGIDVDHITHVINYDLPQFAEDYIHRIGRTGRAGRSGSALSFVADDESRTWMSICRLVKSELDVELEAAPASHGRSFGGSSSGARRPSGGGGGGYRGNRPQGGGGQRSSQGQGGGGKRPYPRREGAGSSAPQGRAWGKSRPKRDRA